MKPDEYGDSYQTHLLEQYQLYVEMADRVSQRRDQSNRFYVTLLSAIVALLVVLARFGASGSALAVVFLIGGLFGAVLSVIWWFNIRSYRQLNRAKFAIIGEIEKQLPYAGYSREWELLRPKSGPPQYFQLTRVEQYVPLLILVLFIGIVAYAVYSLISAAS